MEAQQNKRILHIDIAKGIGILLVVLGHNYYLQHAFPYLFYFIFSFHVPLFFFLSGMVFKTSSSFSTMLREKFFSLLVPFLVTIIFSYLGESIFLNMQFLEAFKRALKGMVFATGLYLEWSQLWFLPVLFLVFLCAYWIVKIVNGRAWLGWLSVSLILIAGQATIRWYWPLNLQIFSFRYEHYGLPYSIDILAPCLSFFLAGFYLVRSNYKRIMGHRIFLLIILVALILLNIYSNARMDLFKRIYDSIFINTLEAGLGIFFVLGISLSLEDWFPSWSNFLVYFGKNSLFILLYHLIIEANWSNELSKLTNNSFAIIFISFIVGILGSLLISEFFIKQNPIAFALFTGKRPKSSEGNFSGSD